MVEGGPYTYTEGYWGLPAPDDGETGWTPDEQAKVNLIGSLFQRTFDAIGKEVIAGGGASISGADIVISELEAALIEDTLGAVPVTKAETTIPNSSIPNGTTYIHCQLGEDGRLDGSCGYYVSASAIPADDALIICKVTKAAGTISAVDNTVKDRPAIQERLPWENFKRSYDDATTLLAFLTYALGPNYLDGSEADDLDTRVSDLESAAPGGPGGTVYWGGLLMSVSVATTIVQYILAQFADHLANYQHGGDGNGTLEVLEPWDVDSVNDALSVLTEIRMVNHLAAWNHIDALTVVEDSFGEGSHGTVDFVDHVNSTWH